MSREEIPPWLREQLARFDQLQQNLQAILVQKQQVELEIADIEKALTELNKVAPDEIVYKAAGSLMIRANKEELLKELSERKEIANTRSMVLAKQEVRIRESVKELQGKIDSAIRSRAPSPLQPPES